MADPDFTGPGPSRGEGPWTSKDAGADDKAAHRRIVSTIVRQLEPKGGNAYEVWSVWNQQRMTYGAPPSQNHVNARLGELIDLPFRPGRDGRPDRAARDSKFRVNGHSVLRRPGITHATGTGRRGLVFYIWRKRTIPRQ